MPQDQVYSDVVFEFLSYEDDANLKGLVKIRGKYMVLDIPEDKNQGPYLLKAEKTEDGYSAHNSGRNPIPVEARWAHVGNGQYVGLWVENGHDFYFRFELVKQGAGR